MLIERDRLLDKINKDLRKKTAAQLASEINIPAMTLGRIVRGLSKGSIDTWESIASYYSDGNKKVPA